MTKQYGKPSLSLIQQKESFFSNNNHHVWKQKQISNIYTSQPKRKRCKNCASSLNARNDFSKDGIEYKICDVCTHLNGAFEDTSEFCQAVYTNDDGSQYAENYGVISKDDFDYRVSSIYLPKAEFLITSIRNDLKKRNLNNKLPSELSYFDFGAGSGYFVSALDRLGLYNISGSEVSKVQVEHANRALMKELLSVHHIDESNKLLRTVCANVVSMIGVLEHLQDPRAAVASIMDNENIEYLYISVPLFSLSVYIEMLSDDIFHRHLHGGHTHLYTRESLYYMANEFGFDVVSEWWFGTDIVDFYRNLFVNMERKGVSDKLLEEYKVMMEKIIDSMQMEIDKKELSSEVHILFRKKNV